MFTVGTWPIESKRQPENSPYASPVPKRILNTGAKLTHQHVSKPLPANTTGEGSKNSRASVLLGKNTAALLKLVRIHFNDTISHPLVKQSTCSQGVWNHYQHASTQPCCLLLLSKGSLQYKPLCPAKFRVGTAGTLTTHQKPLAHGFHRPGQPPSQGKEPWSQNKAF